MLAECRIRETRNRITRGAMGRRDSTEVWERMLAADFYCIFLCALVIGRRMVARYRRATLSTPDRRRRFAASQQVAAPSTPSPAQ